MLCQNKACLLVRVNLIIQNGSTLCCSHHCHFFWVVVFPMWLELKQICWYGGGDTTTKTGDFSCNFNKNNIIKNWHNGGLLIYSSLKYKLQVLCIPVGQSLTSKTVLYRLKGKHRFVRWWGNIKGTQGRRKGFVGVLRHCTPAGFCLIPQHIPVAQRAKLYSAHPKRNFKSWEFHRQLLSPLKESHLNPFSLSCLVSPIAFPLIYLISDREAELAD